jgi:transposase-like protein
MEKIPQYSAGYKFARVVDTLRKDNLVDVGRRYRISPKLLSKWRIKFMENGHKVFETEPDKDNALLRKQVARLEQLIGKKEIELSFMQNFLENSNTNLGK